MPAPAVDPMASPLAHGSRSGLQAEHRALADIPRETWDQLAARNPWATPFSSWAFQRAWWDAYGANAHEDTLVILERGAGLAGGDGRSSDRIVGIAPLMHRHEVEPEDASRRTMLRHGHEPDLTPVAPTAKAVFFGASYHADYATLLGAPDDMPVIAEAVAERLAGPTGGGDPDHGQPWDVVDLRRLRAGDPAADALAVAFGRREVREGWRLTLEPEDVCPVVSLPERADLDTFLATLDKKERHEIRRKVRRAEAAGEIRLDASADPVADLPAFIDLHQRRWGADGLFPPTAGGTQSRVFFRRLFELFGGDGPLRLSFLSVGDRRVAAGIHFEAGDSLLYYNAGVDPDARDLSPGVLLVERIVRRALAEGRRRLDFLRGAEPYKYEWGAVDEPILRLLVRRDA